MATRNICDGTGVEIPEETPTTGHFGKQYCDEARPLADEYLAKLDKMHTAAAEKWSADLAALKAEYRPLLTSLPDEP